ncbi:MAG: hypothetical protein PVJ64_03600 [Gemmatimonadales bacterium]|jgi:hypothetical protein
MPDGNAGRLAAKANQLYWGTAKPAGRLAEELGISRSKFYGLIEPLNLDAQCPDCGEPLTFSSRSDREANRGRCPECGAVTQIPDGEAPAAPPPAAERDACLTPTIGERLALPGVRELWLTAIAGAALGLLITGWWRRR